MSLLDFCQWLENTPLGTGIRESIWWFPMLEITHSLGIIMMAGTIMLLDLRLIGVALRREPVSNIAAQILPWTWTGFGFMAITGIGLLLSETVKCYKSTSFRIKLLLLLFAGVNALIFNLTVFRGVRDWDETAAIPARARVAGLISLLLWIGIIAAGRAVGYEHIV